MPRAAQSKLKLSNTKPVVESGILDFIMDAVFACDLQMHFIYINAAACKMYGYKKEEFLKMRYSQLEAREQALTLESRIKKLLETGEIIAESVHLRKNKTMLPVEMHSSFVKSGAKNIIINVVRDITERKKVEESLRESERRYRTLFDKTLDPILVIDSEGNYIDCNDAALEFMECRRDELLTKNIKDFILPGKEEEALKEQRPLWEKGGIVETEYYIHGKIKIMRLTITPVTWEGKPVIFKIGEDITSRKKTEMALRESEEKFRNLFDNALDVILIVDAGGNIVDINNAVESYGYKKDEILGMSQLKFILQEYWLQVTEDLRVVLQGKSTRAEIEIITLKGRIAVEYISTPVKKGTEIVGAQIILRDITERKKSEEELSRHNKDLLALSKAISSIIGITRIKDIYQSICESATELFNLKLVWMGLIEEGNYQVKPVAYAGFDEGYVLDNTVRYDDSAQGAGPEGVAIKTQRPSLMNIHDPGFMPWRKEAEKRGYASVLAIPFACEGKGCCGVLSFYSSEANYFTLGKVELFQIFVYEASIAIENVKLIEGLEGKIRERTGELELKEKEAEEAEFQAEAANKAKSDFLAHMSHELRTPLNSVIGFSDVLSNELFGTLNEKQKEYVNYILSSGKHLLSLINDMLDLTKIESGNAKLEFSPFLLKNVINTSVVMLKERALQHRIKLHVGISPDADIALEADERKFKEILFNLLSNAIKFTPDDGSVWVRAKKISGDYIEISVEDIGIGIKPEDIDKLFKPFMQIDSRLTRGYEGTGLGLVLVKRLVELHGGRISVESTYGKGSTFTFTIPLKQQNSGSGGHTKKGGE